MSYDAGSIGLVPDCKHNGSFRVSRSVGHHSEGHFLANSTLMKTLMSVMCAYCGKSKTRVL